MSFLKRKVYVSKMILIIFFIFALCFVAASNIQAQEQSEKNTLTNKGFNLFPDEYSELDDIPTPSSTRDELVLATLEKSRQQYIQALIHIEKGDTNSAVRCFELAINILNRLVSYPEIEQNEDFSDLVQSIIEDYESFVQNIDALDENSSLFIIRDKLFQEIEGYITILDPDIQSIEIPKEIHATGLAPQAFELTIPLDDNKSVRKSLSFLTQKKVGKLFIKKCLGRSPKWFPMMRKIAEEEDLPLEIIFLSMIESGLNANAVSKAKAVGLWQFIRSTGELYGLNKSSSFWIDERRDPEKSTQAAMRHIRDLYNEFGDWHLALAAYNCGAGCVHRAIRKTNIQNPNFWDIQKKLPRETRNYVPLYIAATKIALNPKAYGFNTDELEYHDEYQYETVELSESVNLGALAKCINITEEELKNLNPELIRSFIPPDQDNYPLKIPVGTKQQFITNFSTLTEEEKQPWIFHKVKRRETLSKLSNIYGVSRNEIAALNGLRSYKSKIRTGTTLRIPIPRREVNDKDRSSLASETSKTRTSASGADLITHTVKRGENLYKIAQRYGIRITDLRNLNDIPYDEDNIHVGTKLIIAQNQSAAGKTQPEITKIKRPKIIKHKVRRGETLAQLADEYSVSIANIRDLNRISGNKIITGQILKIETNSDKKKSRSTTTKTARKKVTHKVRRGETISTIAARYGVRESEIKKWNPGKIKGTTIFSGTYLKIYSNKSAKGSSYGSKKVNRPPKYYKIRKGDTLGSIARKFGVSVSSLKRKNKNLNERRLQIGKRIRIQ